MADIHWFPTQINDKSIHRLTEKLSAAFEAGEDLGSRVNHIHALAEALERTLIRLDYEIDVLKACSLAGEAEIFLQKAVVEEIRTQLKKLIVNARIFPAASQ